MYIFDFTRAYTLSNPVSIATTFLRQNSIPLSSAICICQQPQQTDLRNAGFVDIRISHSSSHLPQLLQEIMRSAKSRLHIVSYNGAILKYGIQLGQASGLSTRTNSFSNLLNSDQVSSVSSHPAQQSWPVSGSNVWRFDHIVTLEDAITILRNGLARFGYDSEKAAIRKSSVMQLLGQVDQRFRLQGSSQQTGTTGMVTQLLNEAENRGLIQQNWIDSVNPAVYLVNNEDKATIAETLNSCLEVPKDTDTRTLNEDSILKHRSRRFERSLRNARLGPYSRIRIKVYESLEVKIANSNLHEQKPERLCDLVAKAVKEVQESYSGNPVPWRDIQPFVIDLLLRSRCVLDREGNEFPQGIRGATMEVGSFHTNWMLKADSQLLLHLIRVHGDVDSYDLSDIGGVLYHDRSDAGATKALELLAFLEGASLIEQGKKGAFGVFQLKQIPQ